MLSKEAPDGDSFVHSCNGNKVQMY